jgi:hypothetical protein
MPVAPKTNTFIAGSIQVSIGDAKMTWFDVADAPAQVAIRQVISLKYRRRKQFRSLWSRESKSSKGISNSHS